MMPLVGMKTIWDEIRRTGELQRMIRHAVEKLNEINLNQRKVWDSADKV